MILRTRRAVVEFPRRPLVMGIVNLSADSFSGDGLSHVDAALELARRHVADGADIIDIGAESARTNRGPIPIEEESARLLEFVEGWNRRSPTWRGEGAGLLSINTWRPEVARAVLPQGGDMLNDIGALPTAENAAICAETGAALVIMHTVGQPKVPHTHVTYPDVVLRLEEFFADKIRMAGQAGLSRDAIILDPGIDFAKQRDDNLRIYRDLERFRHFGRPLLLPISRKTVIGDVLQLPAAERDAGTIASLVAVQLRGAGILRVHNVRAAAQAVRIIEAIGTAG